MFVDVFRPNHDAKIKPFAEKGFIVCFIVFRFRKNTCVYAYFTIILRPFTIYRPLVG